MSAETGQVRREVVMVGPPYLYDGAQVCGRKTSRTCIFLLATFGAALTMIGVVFFTADLRRTSGLWVAGVVFIPIGVALLSWFLVLCCAARHAFRSLPAAHPARTKPSRTMLVPSQASSTYQLLPMTPTRSHVTPNPHVSATHTLPLPGIEKIPTAPEPDGYPTWGYNWHIRQDMAGQPRVHPAVDTWGYSPQHAVGYQELQGYPYTSTLMPYDTQPLRAHTLDRPSPGIQRSSYAAGDHIMNLSATLASQTDQRGDDSPPPYHSVVSGP